MAALIYGRWSRLDRELSADCGLLAAIASEPD